MHDALDKYLCRKYPKIYANRHKSPRETCMCWGFPGNGWFFLLDALSKSIQAHIDNPYYTESKSLLNFLKRIWNFLCLVIPRRHRWKFTLRLKMKPVKIPQLVADQVKEKFGGLRFYSSGGDEYTRGMIHLAEELSHYICEECGTMDDTVECTGRGWVRTLCLKCRKPDEVGIHLEVQRKLNLDRTLAWIEATKVKCMNVSGNNDKK